MSADRFEKNQRGYAYSATRPLGSLVEKRLTVRQPSECRSPRRNSHGNRSTTSRCQSASSILRSCLRPGPCCGNASGQRLLSATTLMQRRAPSGWTRMVRGSAVRWTASRHASTSAGYAASHVITRRYVRECTAKWPSPRYRPSRWLYAAGSGGRQAGDTNVCLHPLRTESRCRDGYNRHGSAPVGDWSNG